MFNSKESLIVTEIMKLGSTVSNVAIEVFIFCYLFELIDDKVIVIKKKNPIVQII